MILFAPLWLGFGLMTGNPMLLASWLLQPKSRSGRQQWQDQRSGRAEAVRLQQPAGRQSGRTIGQLMLLLFTVPLWLGLIVLVLQSAPDQTLSANSGTGKRPNCRRHSRSRFGSSQPERYAELLSEG